MANMSNRMQLVAASVGLIVALGAATGFVLTRTAADQGEQDFMLARPCPEGAGCRVTWTLTSRLGQILEFYGKQLGPANPRYRLLGIEFTSDRRPRIWYPDYGKGHNSIIVQLTSSARRKEKRALFQLAHEAFHLLEPVKPGSRASVFEEGLATYFAFAYLRSIGWKVDADYIADAAYQSAYEAVARLADGHGDFIDRLRRLRQRKQTFSALTAADLQETFTYIDAAQSESLAQPFK